MGHGPPSRRRSRSSDAVQITDRDRLLLAFAAEQRFVTAAQIAVVLATTVPAADTRLRTLSSGGYLRREQKLYGSPAGFRATRAGLRAAGSDLPTPRTLDVATFHHEQAVGWLMLFAQRGRFGPLRDVVSERRMRSQDGRHCDRETWHGVRLGGVGPNGRERLHYPDLVVVTEAGHRVAFELELTTKSRGRRETILAGYAADRRIDAVIYLVDRPAAGAAIERSAARIGISDMVRVQNVRVGRPSAPAAGGRTVQRRHGRDGRSSAPAAESGR